VVLELLAENALWLRFLLENVEGGRTRASWQMRIDEKRRTKHNVLKHVMRIKVNKATQNRM